MTTPAPDAKARLRRIAYDARREEVHKDAKSEAALARLMATPQYQRAGTVMWYVDCRSELRTRRSLVRVLDKTQRVVVPYCAEDEQNAPRLGLFLLKHLQELSRGRWQILEPASSIRNRPERRVSVEELDLVIVPGVGFTQTGQRLGNGQGYYDRLLADVRKDCLLYGVCFECQLFETIPSAPHDIRMNAVATEKAIYTVA